MSFQQHPHQGQYPYQGQHPHHGQYPPHGHWNSPLHPQYPQSYFSQQSPPPSFPVPPIATGPPYSGLGYPPHPAYQGGYSGQFQPINQSQPDHHCVKDSKKRNGAKEFIKYVGFISAGRLVCDSLTEIVEEVIS
ncbi:forkhead box protein B2-like [Oryzias latipes]|uniref:forkhead box protein B2-like n=1 Tax=Oryzias latipes TaxID=8090 RepID=UPI000CE1A615|nr:forkhead box protein B2-like [Oryzias latipes]